MPECVRGGYVFLGWENEEGEIVREIDRSNAGDMSLTAAWRASDEGYAITYVLDGGKTDKPNPEQVLCGEILTLNAPVKEGYVFLGWYDNPEGRGTRYVCTPAGARPISRCTRCGRRSSSAAAMKTSSIKRRIRR